MKYYSTRSGSTAATGPEAILRGIAPDGGLTIRHGRLPKASRPEEEENGKS